MRPMCGSRLAAVVRGRDRHGGGAALDQLPCRALWLDVPGRGAVVRAEHDDVGLLLLGEHLQPLAGRGADDDAALDLEVVQPARAALEQRARPRDSSSSSRSRYDAVVWRT